MELSQKQALEFKECLQYYLSPNSKKSWVKTLRLLKITPTKVILEGIPHKVYRYEIKNNHEELFIRVLDKLYPEDSPFSDKIFEYKIGVSKRSKKSLQTEFDLNQYSTDEKFEFTMSSNKDKNIAKLLNIDYWTTIVVYKNNKEIARKMGLTNKDEIYNLIKKGI